MKAAVLYEFGAVPRHEEFPDPVINDGELGVKVEAVILDYALKALASGTHFASKQFYPSFPAIIGRSGVGLLDDGTPVSFQSTRFTNMVPWRKGSPRRSPSSRRFRRE